MRDIDEAVAHLHVVATAAKISRDKLTEEERDLLVESWRPSTGRYPFHNLENVLFMAENAIQGLLTDEDLSPNIAAEYRHMQSVLTDLRLAWSYSKELPPVRGLEAILNDPDRAGEGWDPEWPFWTKSHVEVVRRFKAEQAEGA